jgi:hypothetical protein
MRNVDERLALFETVRAESFHEVGAPRTSDGDYRIDGWLNMERRW